MCKVVEAEERGLHLGPYTDQPEALGWGVGGGRGLD